MFTRCSKEVSTITNDTGLKWNTGLKWVKNFAKFTGKHPCLFFNKAVHLRPSTLQVSSCEFSNISEVNQKIFKCHEEVGMLHFLRLKEKILKKPEKPHNSDRFSFHKIFVDAEDSLPKIKWNVWSHPSIMEAPVFPFLCFLCRQKVKRIHELIQETWLLMNAAIWLAENNTTTKNISRSFSWFSIP